MVRAAPPSKRRISREIERRAGDREKECHGKEAKKRVLVRGDAIVQRVLSATIDELARVGYGALRIEEVAQRAEVNKTTVYRRWPEKCELVRDALTCVTRPETEPPETGDLRGDLMALGKGLVQTFKAPRGQTLMRMMVAEGSDTELADIKRGLRRERQVIPLAALRAAIARGELGPDTDVQLLLDTFVGAIHHRIFFMGEPGNAAFLERLVDLLLDGVRVCDQRRARPVELA